MAASLDPSRERERERPNHSKPKPNLTVTTKAAYYYKVRLMNLREDVEAGLTAPALPFILYYYYFGWQLMKFICHIAAGGRGVVASWWCSLCTQI